MNKSYIVYGVDASYFTQKVLGFMTYLGLPVDYRKRTVFVRQEIEQRAGTHFMPVVVTPGDEYLWDSTPLGVEMDRRASGPGLWPPNPVQRLVARVIEDFFDEWMTRPAVHFRWQCEVNAESSGAALVCELLGLDVIPAPDDGQRAMFDDLFTTLRQWGAETCHKIGAVDKGAIENEFTRVMRILNRHFVSHAFLLGNLPSLADFSLYGGLHAHFLRDPTPRALIDEQAPNLIKFRDRMKVLRAENLTDTWQDTAEIAPSLLPLLVEIGRGFVRFLEANRRALEAGQRELSFDFGAGEERVRSRKYTEACRAEIAHELSSLDDRDQGLVREILDPAGCYQVYAD